jgi:molybdopterin biosynthesis enzyme
MREKAGKKIASQLDMPPIKASISDACAFDHASLRAANREFLTISGR